MKLKSLSRVLAVVLCVMLLVSCIPFQASAEMTGDVNNDGVIDIMDSILVQKYTSDEAELTPEQLEAADVNGDGSVDVLDAMDIQKYASDKISEFSKKA